MAEQSETDWNEQLHQAIRDRDEYGFCRALENGADVNARLGDNYMAALHLIVNSMALSEARTALRAGADPNIKTRTGITPLYTSANQISADFTNLLLDWGADPAIYRKSGSNPPYLDQPLHEAVRKNHVEVAKALLKAGADPLAVDRDGRTPVDSIPDYAEAKYDFLREAANWPRVEVTESLSKADLLAPDENGMTPLDNPVTWRHWPQIGETLQEKGEALTKEELLLGNANGTPRLLVAADARMLRPVVESLNAGGEALTMQELEATGITRQAQASQSHLFRSLACESNIRAQGAGVFLQSLRELPQEAKDDLPNRHQLAATVRHITRDQGLQR